MKKPKSRYLILVEWYERDQKFALLRAGGPTKKTIFVAERKDFSGRLYWSQFTTPSQLDDQLDLLMAKVLSDSTKLRANEVD